MDHTLYDMAALISFPRSSASRGKNIDNIWRGGLKRSPIVDKLCFMRLSFEISTLRDFQEIHYVTELLPYIIWHLRRHAISEISIYDEAWKLERIYELKIDEDEINKIDPSILPKASHFLSEKTAFIEDLVKYAGYGLSLIEASIRKLGRVLAVGKYYPPDLIGWRSCST